jgi:uncharacterized protein (DUF488 family)
MIPDDTAVMVFSVGHGTLTADGFAALLRRADIAAVVDVRRFPGSRRHPHFAADALRQWLPRAGIAYGWEERLGGRRSRRADSVNVALRNDSFRGYADYMAEPPFRDALDAVLEQARQRPTAIMCAESLWWRCHRRLLADAAVLLRGAEVRHLLHDGRMATHAITDSARRAGDLVVYDRLTQGELLGVPYPQRARRGLDGPPPPRRPG